MYFQTCNIKEGKDGKSPLEKNTIKLIDKAKEQQHFMNWNANQCKNVLYN